MAAECRRTAAAIIRLPRIGQAHFQPAAAPPGRAAILATNLHLRPVSLASGPDGYCVIICAAADPVIRRPRRQKTVVNLNAPRRVRRTTASGFQTRSPTSARLVFQ